MDIAHARPCPVTRLTQTKRMHDWKRRLLALAYANRREGEKKTHEPFLSFITDALLLNRKANACKMKPRGEDAGKRFPEQIRLRRTTMMMIMMKNMIGCLIFSAYFLLLFFLPFFFFGFLVVDVVLLVCLQCFFTVPKRSLRSKDAPAIQNIVQIEGKESFFFSSFFLFDLQDIPSRWRPATRLKSFWY